MLWAEYSPVSSKNASKFNGIFEVAVYSNVKVPFSSVTLSTSNSISSPFTLIINFWPLIGLVLLVLFVNVTVTLNGVFNTTLPLSIGVNSRFTGYLITL